MIDEPKRSHRGRDAGPDIGPDLGNGWQTGGRRAGPKKPPEGDTSWMESAACRGKNADLFFPGRGDDYADARRICAGCPVRSECLAYAMDRSLYHGIWGGLTTKERRRVRRKRNEAKRAARA